MRIETGEELLSTDGTGQTRRATHYHGAGRLLAVGRGKEWFRGMILLRSVVLHKQSVLMSSTAKMTTDSDTVVLLDNPLSPVHRDVPDQEPDRRCQVRSEIRWASAACSMCSGAANGTENKKGALSPGLNCSRSAKGQEETGIELVGRHGRGRLLRQESVNAQGAVWDQAHMGQRGLLGAGAVSGERAPTTPREEG